MSNKSQVYVTKCFCQLFLGHYCFKLKRRRHEKLNNHEETLRILKTKNPPWEKNLSTCQVKFTSISNFRMSQAYNKRLLR